MNLALIRIREIFPHFNERPITEADFWRVAKKYKIIVRPLPLSVEGYYQRKKGRDYILINDKLTGLRWLHIALHELCHFIFDAPCETDGYTLFRGSKAGSDRREQFADAFALIALLPFPDLVRLAHEDLTDDPWLLRLAHDRIIVRTIYGI